MSQDLFDDSGKMLAAIRPPDAIIPFRNGTESFSAASPPHYIDDGEGPLPNPEHPDTGRENNHGFEGLTLSEDGETLWVLLQAATVQEGVSSTCLCKVFSKVNRTNKTPGTREADSTLHPISRVRHICASDPGLHL